MICCLALILTFDQSLSLFGFSITAPLLATLCFSPQLLLYLAVRTRQLKDQALLMVVRFYNPAFNKNS
jgi:hypothetical protein